MENIPIGRVEQEPQKNDDIRLLITKQEECRMKEFLEKIQEQLAVANRAKGIIDVIEGDISTPTIIIEIGFDTYEYDVYSYGSHRIETNQYTIRSESLHEAIDTVARHLVESGRIDKDNRMPELDSVGLVLGPAAFHTLDAISQEIRHLFSESLKKYGFK